MLNLGGINLIYNGLFESFECVATLGCLTMLPIILTLPNFIAQYFGTAGFLYAVYSNLIAALFFYILFKLFRQYKGKDILDVAEIAGGKIFMICSGIIIVLFLISSATLTLAEVNENAKNVLLSEAPKIYITLLFMIPTFIGCIVGLKGIFRASAILAPFIIISFIIMFIVLFSKVDFTNFTPIFGNGISNLFLGGAYKITGYESISLLFLIAPNIKNFDKTSKQAFLMTSFFLLSAFFLIWGTLSYPALKDNYLPFFEVTKLISYGRFIQRIESIFVLVWLIATYIYLSVCICFAALILRKIFNIKHLKLTIAIISLLVFSLCLMLSSYVDILRFREILAMYCSPFIIVLLPLFVLLLAKFKNSNNKEQSYASY